MDNVAWDTELISPEDLLTACTVWASIDVYVYPLLVPASPFSSQSSLYVVLGQFSSVTKHVLTEGTTCHIQNGAISLLLLHV